MIKKLKKQHKGLKDNNPEYLIVHTTASSKLTDFEDVYQWHVNERGWEWVGYQYLILWDGKVVHCRPDKTHGAHAKGFNTKSIGIAMCGNNDVHLPSQEQKKALKKLLRDKMQAYDIPVEKIIAHREAQDIYYGERRKTCFGRRLKDDWARELLRGKENTCEKERSIIKLLISYIVKLLKK